jgi:hypothetical protein
MTVQATDHFLDAISRCPWRNSVMECGMKPTLTIYAVNSQWFAESKDSSVIANQNFEMLSAGSGTGRASASTVKVYVTPIVARIL